MTKKNLVFVAVDAGSGNVALTFERDGKMFTQVTPALVRQGNQQTIASETTSSWITDGRNYAVVKQGTDLVDTCDPDYQVSAAHRVLVIDALVRAGLTDCDVVLAETLPVNQFYADKGVIDHARIDAKVKSLMTPVRNYNDAIAAPRIVHVEVFPEAIPAVVSAQTDNPSLTEAQTLLVADLGRFTCDLAVVDSELQVVSRLTTENGVHVMINRLHALLQDFEATSGKRIDAKNLSIESIDPIIRQGYVGSRLEAARDKRIDVTALIERAAAELSEIIRSDIRKLHRNLRDIDAILLVGGGANYIAGKIHGLGDHTADWHDLVITPDNPEMSIVRGVYMALMASRDDIIAELNG
ncbi:ParM/StbA family protein [Escherichia coli]|nr:ParM/StbA family protein [Escherichia coli]MCU3341310.1 ParM/StbA family protein [Enterobacter hormaechei subsp. hoffmannii]UVN08037.1 MAG: StbA protein [Bacteriophage sp.]